MNQLVLFIGEDQNHIQKLLNYLIEDYSIENIDIPESQSSLVNQIRILKSKTSSRFEESIHIVYTPSICYKNEQLLFVLKNITQFCKQLKLIICLDDDKDIQEKTKNISQNIAQVTFPLITQNIFFFIKNSPKSNKQSQNIIQYFDEKNLNKWNLISLIKQPCKLQIQQQLSQQQLLFTYEQIYQFKQGEDLLYQFESCISNESQQQLNLQNNAFTNIIAILAILNKYQYNNSWKSYFKECNKCQFWIEENRNFLTILDIKEKKVDVFETRYALKYCQKCKEQLSYKNYLDILTQLNKKILLDYFKILDQFIVKQESSSSQSVLVLNNEILSQTSLFKRLYPDINESKVQFTIGSDIQDQFYLISAPEFEFSLDQEEVLSKYQKFLKQSKINYIICCLNFQRYDLMKQRAQEMLKFLNGVNRLQIGFFIFCENAQDHEFEKVFNGFKNLVGQIQTISQNDGQANIFHKINSLVSEGGSDLEINFQNTLFQSYDEDDDEETQVNYKQLVQEIEQKEIENLTSKIIKEKEYQNDISQEINKLYSKIKDLENLKKSSIQQMEVYEKGVRSLKQYSQQDQVQQKKNKKKRR